MPPALDHSVPGGGGGGGNETKENVQNVKPVLDSDWLLKRVVVALQSPEGIFYFSSYLGTKLDMLFKIAKSVEIVISLGKKHLFYPKILGFMQI